MSENTNKNEIETPDYFSDSEQENLYGFIDNEVPAFVKLSDKYKDITSSAFTMLFVGCAGLLLMLLIINQLIPIPLNPSTSWLFNSVMGGIFIIFIIAGIISLMHAKQVKIDAQKEDALIDKILQWAKENFTAEKLDEDLDLTQPQELLYFNRTDKIKETLMREFENADEALIYEYTEQIYQTLYESDNQD